MHRRAALIALVVCALVAGCGSRLTDEQRAALVVSQGGGSGTQEGTAPVEDGAVPGTDSTAGQPGANNPQQPNKQPNPPGSIAGTCQGTGGATDKGVTAGEITIANISDISGPVPGLFQSAQEVVDRRTASRFGCGRRDECRHCRAPVIQYAVLI